MRSRVAPAKSEFEWRLGAHRKDVFALIMRQGALQTALAFGVGLLLSLAAGRVLAQILYEVSPSDPFALDHIELDARRRRATRLFLPRAPRDPRQSDDRAANGIRESIYVTAAGFDSVPRSYKKGPSNSVRRAS